MAKYLKQDSKNGFVEDYADVQSLIFDNVCHTVLGNMLGDYDDQGYYRVHPDIVKELIEMPKYVVEVMDNLEICLGAIKFDKQISFLVAFEGEKATLSLIEKISFEGNNKLDGGTWSNVNEYVLDVVETSGEINRQALYIRWNIQAFGGNVIDIFNCEASVLEKYFNIVNRFKYNLEAKTILLEKEAELEEIEAEYFLDLFSILEEYPELKKVVEKELKQTLTEKKDFVKLDKPNFVKTINEIVNKSVEKNIDVLPEEKQAEFLVDKRNITVKSNIKKYDTLPIDVEKVEKSDKSENVQINQEISVVVTPKENTQVVTPKITTNNPELKPLEEVAAKYVAVEKQTNEKVKDRAISVLLGIDNKPENDKTVKEQKTLLGTGVKKVAQVVYAVVRTGVAAATVVSAPVIAAVAGVKAAEQAVENTTKAVENAIEKVVAPEKKPEAKKTETKKSPTKTTDTKKPAATKQKPSTEKEKTKEEKNNTAQTSSGGFYATGSTTGPQSNNDRIDTTNMKNNIAENNDGNATGLIGERAQVARARIVNAAVYRYEEGQAVATGKANAEQEVGASNTSSFRAIGNQNRKVTNVTMEFTRRTTTSLVDENENQNGLQQ